MVAENYRMVDKKVQEACARAGRDRNEVTLIAVSKTKPVAMIQEAMAAGANVFGENKVQELCDKYELLPKDLHWHLIGHLQRNKVKYIIGKVDLIHSVDSLRLAEEISKEAVKKETPERWRFLPPVMRTKMKKMTNMRMMRTTRMRMMTMKN